MTPFADTHRFDRRFAQALALALSLSLAATVATAGALPTPGFFKEFMPDTIGPGSTAMLTFTIDNSESAAPVSGLAFTDTLPSGVTLATPGFVSNTCLLDVGGSVTAPDGGTAVSLTGGLLGAGKTCRIVVNVTAGAVDDSDTTYMNLSGDLTSSAGNSGPASDDLMVDIDRPGFSKAFSTAPPTDPPTVALGGRSALTFTFDNSLNGAEASFLAFSDTLPAGMVVANPANVVNTCASGFFTGGVVGASPGTNVITLSSGGGSNVAAVAAFGTCTIKVDVVATGVGSLGNVSASANGLVGLISLVLGKAAAVLEVTGFETALALEKEFTDDPVVPGGTVTLEFTITNQDRDDSATAITFDDDLETTLSGLTPTLPPTPDPPCGAGSMLTFSMGVLTLTGGTLGPEGSCTFGVELTVDSMSSPGAYPNTTTAITGDVGGSPVTGNAAGDILFVVDFPVLTKEFTDDPVAAGGTVTLEFTITNPSTSAMSAIAFIDELTDGSGGFPPDTTSGFLPFPVSVTLPPTPDPPCGGGSALALISLGSDRQGLSLTGGSLAASGSPGDSCTFSVTVGIPTGFPGGTYTNTTEPISATLDDEPGTPTVVGPPATDTIIVAGAPTLTKEFTDDPVLPSGGSVTLEFNLSYEVDEGTPDATAIAFTDDLTTLFAGLVAASVDTNTCSGALVDISTPTLISVSGGTLTAGQSCTISLTLTVPSGAPVGFHTNTTSDITATVDGVSATSSGATDDLLVTPLVFTKEFLDAPDGFVIPGDTVTLRFTIANNGASPADDATITFFTDNLAADLPGLAATGPPSVNTCGGALSGTTFLTYVGGSVAGGATCTIEVDVLVPAMAADGDYLNSTSSLFVTIGGNAVSVPPATDVLSVDSTLLELTKEFTDDPVLPDSPVTLKFTLTNLSATHDVTDIAFSDDLGAALGGLTATDPAISNTCGGMATLPATLFDYSGGSLTAGTSCMIELSVAVPPAPLPGDTFPNTTSGVTGKVGALDVVGSPASDDLEVRLLTLSKSFDGPTFADETAVLSFTITNLDSTSAATDLAFSDNLDAVISGLVAVLPTVPSPPCGAGSVAAGTGFFTVTGASLAPAGSPGDSCTFEVVVAVPASATPGSFLNTTSRLRQFGLPVADRATAFLDILATEADLAVAKSDLFEPVMAGRHQLYTVTVSNLGPATAKNVVLTDALPPGVVPVLIEPIRLCAAAGGVVTCGLGDLGDGATVTVGMQVYVAPVELPAMLDNMATVTSDTTDPVPGNNDVIEANEVLPMTGVAALADSSGNAVSEVAVPLSGSIEVLVKDSAPPFTTLHQTEVFPGGWALAGFEKKAGIGGGLDDLVVLAVETATGAAEARVVAGADGAAGATAVVPTGFLPLAMDVIPDDGTGRALVVIAARRLSDGRNRLFVFDAADGSSVAQVALNPAVWPIDVAGVEDFTGDMLAELGTIAVNTTNGLEKLLVKETNGASIVIRTLPGALLPVAVEGVADCCGLPAPELAVLVWDAATGRVRVRTLDADSGLPVGDEIFAFNATPAALATAADYGGSPADELVALYSNNVDRAAARVRDVSTGAQLLRVGFGPSAGSIPLGLAMDGDDLVVYWEATSTGVRKVTVKDGMTGAVVATVPIP